MSTYIKQIEFDNFKSFSGRIKLDFIKGFNMIVGPNGSGKSNVIDALMFVLGASSKKEMRSEVLSDLIFNGGKSGKAADSTKVTVVFDNSAHEFQNVEEKELAISRKVDKNGHSAFRINGKNSTREEILNVLAVIKVRQDSFNIIPQGKIAQIAGSSPQERLAIINDISGISIFEDKKAKAMGELKKAETNISQVAAVQAEKKRTMDKLENERKEALEFKELVKMRDTLTAKQAMIKKTSAQIDLEKIRANFDKATGEIAQKTQERDELYKKIEDNRRDINDINTRAEAEGDKEMVEAEERVKKLDSEILRINTVLESDRHQLESAKEALHSTEQEREQLLKTLDKEKMASREAEDKLAAVNLKRAKLTDEAMSYELYIKEKADLEKQQNEIRQDILKLQLALSNYPKTAQLQAELSSLKGRKTELEAEKMKTTVLLSEMRPQMEKVKKAAKTESDTIFWLRERALNEKVSMGEQHRAIEAANKLKGSISGVHGTVNELFTVSSDAYARAIYRSIGGRGEFIVVDSDETVSRCIEKLRSEKIGSFNFIPLNKITRVEAGKKPETDSVIDYTINLVEFDPKFSAAMKFVFGDTLLVESFEAAKPLMNRYRMVTLDGTIFERTGVVSGGYHKDAGVPSATARIADFNRQIEEHTALQEKYQKELDEKKGIFDASFSKLSIIEEDILKLNKRITELSKEASDFSGSEAELSCRISELEEKDKRLKLRLASLKTPIGEKHDYEREIRDLDGEIKTLELKARTSSTRINDLFSSRLSDFGRRIADLEKEIGRFDANIQDLEKRLIAATAESEAARASLGKKSEALNSLRKKRDELQRENAALEARISEIVRALDDMRQNLNQLSVDKAVLESKLQSAVEEVEKCTVKEVVLEEKDTLTSVKKHLTEIESKISKSGPINERAVEAFELLEKEHAEFETKLTMLNEEKSRIMSVIAEIEAKKLEAFMKTLSEINAIFQKVFNSITDGTAELKPDTLENVFEGGLDIHITLPNKKVHTINALSGGEKSVLSIALILSISGYIDVPFYVLDEVDAALDQINASKFSGIVKSYSDRTQFIIISHNDATMMNSDVIYGVTMTEEGMSKVISVKMPKDGA